MKTLNQHNAVVATSHSRSRFYTILSLAITGISFFLFGYFFQMITVL